ncbi:MAG TPA: GlyGly-CTERM sorting domain-containing protein, partial [Alcanivorax sp.]|nr:GlyGly-CTERM sorting domain-containing protein [Alcanivorax sp.]
PAAEEPAPGGDDNSGGSSGGASGPLVLLGLGLLALRRRLR